MRSKLRHLAIVPPAAEKECCHRFGVGRSLVHLRFPDISREIHPADSLVNFFTGGLQQLPIAVDRGGAVLAFAGGLHVLGVKKVDVYQNRQIGKWFYAGTKLSPQIFRDANYKMMTTRCF